MFVGSTHGKPFGWGSSLRNNWKFKSFLKLGRIDSPKISLNVILRYRCFSPICCVEVYWYSIFQRYITEILRYFNHRVQVGSMLLQNTHLINLNAKIINKNLISWGGLTSMNTHIAPLKIEKFKAKGNEFWPPLLTIVIFIVTTRQMLCFTG